MKIGKYFLVTFLIMLVASSFTGVFASDDNEVSIDNNVLTLHDVKFNIPEEYEEDESQRKLAQTGDDGKYSTCVFVNGDKTIKMTVKYDLASSDFSVEGKVAIIPRTVKNINGFATTNQPMIFMYDVNGNQAHIEAPDEATIEQVLYTET